MVDGIHKLVKLDRLIFFYLKKHKFHFPFEFLVPTNLEEQKKLFFANNLYEPSFNYSSVPANAWHKYLSNTLNQVLATSVTKDFCVFKSVLVRKIRVLMLVVSLIKLRGTKDFTNVGFKIYGNLSISNYVAAKTALALLPRKQPSSLISFNDAQLLFKKFISNNDLDDWNLKADSSIVSVAFADSLTKTITLNRKYSFTRKGFGTLLEHELGVHAKRDSLFHLNSSLYSMGFPRYELLEEGMATYIEVAKCKSYAAVVDSALKYLAVHYAMSMSFRKTYNKLLRFTKSKNLAFDLTLRAKRGTDGSVGAFTKDIVYFSGFLKVLLELKGKKIPDEWLSVKLGFPQLANIGYFKDHILPYYG